MEEKHAVVDPSLCENCKMCQYVCMRNVIKEQKVPDYIYLQRAALLNDALDEKPASEEGQEQADKAVDEKPACCDGQASNAADKKGGDQ